MWAPVPDEADRAATGIAGRHEFLQWYCPLSSRAQAFWLGLLFLVKVFETCWDRNGVRNYCFLVLAPVALDLAPSRPGSTMLPSAPPTSDCQMVPDTLFFPGAVKTGRRGRW